MSQHPRLTDADVEQYLTDHPDFFIGKDELLSDMRIPHNSGQATSLIERQLFVHRERNIELRQRLSDLLENARRNDVLFEKTRRLLLAIVGSKTWLELQGALDDSLRQDFQVDAWQLVHFSTRQLEPPLSVLNEEATQHRIQRLFKGHKAICGQFDDDETTLLLNQSAPNVRSLASAQVRGSHHQGIITVASVDPMYYRSSMDTLFLDYIADVLALKLPQIPIA